MRLVRRNPQEYRARVAMTIILAKAAETDEQFDEALRNIFKIMGFSERQNVGLYGPPGESLFAYNLLWGLKLFRQMYFSHAIFKLINGLFS